MYMHPCAWRVHGVCMACACAFGSRTWHAQLATEVLGEFGGGGGLRVAFRTRAVAAGRALPGEVVTVWLRGEVLAEVWLTEAEAEAEAAGVGVGVGVGGAAARIRTEAWQQVEVEVEVETRAAEGGGASASASAGLVVTLGGVRLFGERPLPLPDWRPVAGWRIGLGARCGEPNPSPSPDFNPNPSPSPSPSPSPNPSPNPNPNPNPSPSPSPNPSPVQAEEAEGFAAELRKREEELGAVLIVRVRARG